MSTKKNQVGEMSTTAKNTTTRKRATKATVSPVQEQMSRLESAYMSAISGEIKFGEVKSIFKQLHKQIKKSVKSKN